jgi:hypothetical protein
MAENKTVVVPIRFTPKQREELQREADRQGFNLSEYIRLTVLSEMRAEWRRKWRRD